MYRITIFDKDTKQIETIECRSLTPYTADEFKDSLWGDNYEYHIDQVETMGDVNRDYKIDVKETGKAEFIYAPCTRAILKIRANRNEIKANGVDRAIIIAEKYYQTGKELKLAGDGNEGISFSCSRGRLSSLKAQMHSGKADVMWTSISETVPVTITASSDTLGSAALDIQLVP